MAPPQGGVFIDEVDAASGPSGDWGRDPDGDDGDAGDVRGHFLPSQPN